MHVVGLTELFGRDLSLPAPHPPSLPPLFLPFSPSWGQYIDHWDYLKVL